MSCLLKFTLTETTGIINTGWLLQGMGELYSITLMACTMFSFLIWKYNALQFISMDALLTIRMIYLTRNITINLPRLNSMLKLCTDGVIDTLTQKYVNYYRQMHMNQNLTPSKHNGRDVAKTNIP
jgi:hypothetical protein